MKIDKNSINDLGDSFIELANSYIKDNVTGFVAGCNIAFTVRSFKYEGDLFFDGQHMYELFAPDTEVEGTAEVVTWEQCLFELSNLLIHPSFKGETHTHKHRMDKPSTELGKRRLVSLFHEVKKYIDLPPEKVYKYIVGKHSDTFIGYVPWYFCYVFLSSGKGMVLNAYAEI